MSISNADMTELMQRVLMVANSQGTVNVKGEQQLIADSNPGYAITNETGFGPNIIRSDLVQTPGQPIAQYYNYYPNPDPDDPDNTRNNYVAVLDGNIFPTQNLYVQTPVQHQTVSVGPLDQRQMIMDDTQKEYALAIRSKLDWAPYFESVVDQIVLSDSQSIA